jgi:uncharacterized membrane protein
MNAIAKKRIDSIDLLKGLVMVIMALDHVRDYFNYSAYLFDPANPTQSTLPLFFTRFITNFCAPAFSLLAGVSAYLVGKRKTKNELSVFLIKRGVWLVFIELTIVNFAWHFDIHFNTPSLLVIWVLGISMIFLAFLIHLPKTGILVLSLIIIFTHNLMDNVTIQDNLFWAIIHDPSVFRFSDTFRLYVDYPIIPWIAVMALGYYIGSFYESSFDSIQRKKIFNLTGIAAIILFFILRATNIYGDPNPFVRFETFSKSLMSFLQVSKYPPSLQFLLITLGGAFLFLANSEKLRGKTVDFFCTFGRVPFFYYIIHVYFIHLAAMLFAHLSGFGWQSMILNDWLPELTHLKEFGFSLFVTYLVWIVIILMLFPLCKWFDKYKQANKEKWWLSYL